MKSLHIAIANLKETFRDFKSNGIVFILPVVFMGIFGIVFNQDFEDTSFEIAIVSYENPEYSAFTKTLSSIQKENQEMLFRITNFDSENKAIESVQNRDNLAAISLDETGKIKITADVSNAFSQAAVSVIKDVTLKQDSIFIVEDIFVDEDYTPFEQMAAGLIVYGLLIMLPQVAASLAKLKDKNYIFRYFTSKATSFDIIGGFAISQLIIGFIQIIILFLTAMTFGFQPKGSILIGFIFSVPITLFVVGLGLLIGSFSPKGETGQNFATMLSIILGFFSGSFFSGIENIGFHIGEKFITITSLVPTYYANDGMRNILLFGQSINSVISEIFIISISAIIAMLLGIILYNNRQLKPEKY